jgi:hypothetical protein
MLQEVFSEHKNDHRSAAKQMQSGAAWLLQECIITTYALYRIPSDESSYVQT